MNKTYKVLIWQMVSIVGLNLAYTLVIADRFEYMGFNNVFDFTKLLTSSLVIIALLLLGCSIRDKFMHAVWHIIFLYLFCGEMIFYQYNPGSSLVIPSLIAILLLFIYMFSLFKVYIKGETISENRIESVLTYLSIAMFLPFLAFYYKYIDIKNLLLIDVYDTRASFRNINIPLIGYLQAPLVRVILPTLIVRNMEKKKYLKVFLFLIMILYIYLCGALKSVFFGLLALLFFYKGTVTDKALRFIISISLLTYIGIAVALIFDNVFLLDSFIRRVFFVPPYLNNIYVNYFTDNYTYLSHSPLGLNLVNGNYGDSGLSMYVGEYVMGLTGLNANVGLLTEGFVSFGFLGGIFFALITALIIFYFKMVKFDPKYFGILFVYIYYFNTSFLSVLLMTHGLFLFMVFSYFFLREKSK